MTVDSSFKRTLGIAMFAAIGTFLVGFDTGIATTTIAHKSWVAYFGHPSAGMTGAVVSMYIAGNAIGAIMASMLGDRLGRIRFMEVMCVFVTVGTIIQTASVNLGMFLLGRVLAGIAVGGFTSTVPIYLSEISSPANRGLIGGLAGCGITFGNFLSNWSGFACSYAPYGPVQWRVPLSIQIPWGIILMCGLLTFMPQSPRELIKRGQVEAGRAAFTNLRTDLGSEEAIYQEFDLMCRQIDFELHRQMPWREGFKTFRHRILISIGTVSITSLCGFNVVAYYQSILYASLGIQSHMILALAGIYGTVAFTVNVLTTVYLTDRWGRRRMILCGVGGIILVEIYLAVMQREFARSHNSVGKGFAVAGIYVFSIFYGGMLNSTTWLYAAEVLPISLRARIVGMGCMTHFIINIALTEAGPTAFANIHENYYYVFVGCSTVFLVLGYFYLPETKQKTLEDIAAAFGDKVVEVRQDDVREVDVAVEGARRETKVVAFHVE